MMRPLLIIFLSVLSFSNLKADINQEVKNLKNEFQQIKEIYEYKIEALEKKIKELEQEKVEHERHASDEDNMHETHEKHKGDSNFNLEAVLNGKYTSFTRSGEVAPKGFGVAHEGERGKEGLYIGESELIIESDIGEKFSGSLTAALVNEDGADKIELEEAYVESLAGSFLDNTYFILERRIIKSSTCSCR